MAITPESDHTLVTTTGVNIARRIGEAISRSYNGDFSFQYADGKRAFECIGNAPNSFPEPWQGSKPCQGFCISRESLLMKYQAFISYKHSEHSRKYALALEHALKKYAKPMLKPPIKILEMNRKCAPAMI